MEDLSRIRGANNSCIGGDLKGALYSVEGEDSPAAGEGDHLTARHGVVGGDGHTKSERRKNGAIQWQGRGR